MMKYWLCLLFFLILFESKAQSKSSTNEDTIENIEYLLKKSDQFINVNLDSALYYSKKSDEIIKKLPENESNIEVYKSLGNIYLARGNYVSALDYLLKGRNVVDKNLIKDPKNSFLLESKIDFLIKLGNVDLQQNNYEEALSFYNKATSEIDKIKFKDPKKKISFQLKILNNMASVLVKKRDFKKALGYFEKARNLNLTLKDEMIEPNLLNNIGICHVEEKEYALAIYYFEEALKLRQLKNDQRGIAQCYNNLGKAYALNLQYDRAKNYFSEAYKIGKSIGNMESIEHSLESLKELYAKTNQYEKAYNMHVSWTNLKDSLFNVETVKHIAQLEMNYKFEKQKENFDINIKQQEIEKDKTRLRYYLIGGGLFFLLIVSSLWIYLQKIKIKNIGLFKDKLELENKNVSLEKDKLTEELDFQNRELTSKVMFLFKKTELINNISEQLIELKKNVPTSNQKQIQDLIFEMRQKKDNDVWTEFETYFTKVHPDFYSKLSQLFPDLTPNEKKLCAFLKLNLSTKDISAITYQSTNSITVSRSRLRKKLNIQGEDTNLTNFLTNL